MRANFRLRPFLVVAAVLLTPLAAVAQSTNTTPKPPTLIGAEPPSGGSSGAGIKWHPGQYVYVVGFYDIRDEHYPKFQQHLAEICDNPNIVGIRWTPSWRTLEGNTRGDYSSGFALTDNVISEAAACDKRVMILVRERFFGSNTETPTVGSISSLYLPAYLLSSTYGPCCGVANGNGLDFGGVVAAPAGSTIGNFKYIAKMWEPAVMDRLIALSDAYSARYDTHPYLEMFGIEETSIMTVPGFSASKWYAQLKRFHSEGADAWPHTMLRMMTNFTEGDLAMRDLFDHCASLPNCVVGGPDPDTNGTLQSLAVYIGAKCSGCTPHDYRSGDVAWIGETQDIGLTVNPIASSHAESAARIQNQYKNTARASHIIWFRGNTAWPASLAQLNSDPTVGRTSCPANFAGCNTN